MVRGSKPYVRSMWDLQKGRRHVRRVRLSPEARLDLRWWADALEALENDDFKVSWRDQSGRRIVVMASDAAGRVGWGVWVGEDLYSGRWTPEQLEWTMPRKEFEPAVKAIEELSADWEGALVVWLTDNITNAYSVNAGSSTTPEGTALLKRLAEVERKRCIDVVAVWFPRELNIVTDALSKALIQGLPLNL